MAEIYFEDWGPGWTALAFTVLLGISVVYRSFTLRRAIDSMNPRILIAGSRGKSGTVRVIHGILRNAGVVAVGKVTGTIAVELSPDGKQVETVRMGTAGIPEMRSAILRGYRSGAKAAVMECMAVQPRMISLVARIVKPQVLVIPTIRLDHLEDEGLTEFEIGTSILESLGQAEHLVAGVNQPELQKYYREYCERNGMQLHLVAAEAGQPVVIGQHPTNVALGLKVAEILGLPTDGFETSVSVEPEAAVVHEIMLGRRRVSFCDIGGANDPESAADAMRRLKLPETEAVVPVIINRWDRPLRAVSFLAAIDGNFPAVLISGSIPGWGESLIREQAPLAVIGHLTKGLAGNLEQLVDYLDIANPELVGQNIMLVALQNTHDPAADRLRKQFHERGTQHQCGDWTVSA